MKFEIQPEYAAEIKALASKREITPDEALEVVVKYGISRMNALGKYAKTHPAGDKPAKKVAKKAAKKAAKAKGPLARKVKSAEAAQPAA